jgi:hypothetical protein
MTSAKLRDSRSRSASVMLRPTTRKRLPRHWAKYANAAKVRFKRTQTA